MWEYYSTERPLTPGAMPEGAVKVVNYDKPKKLYMMADKHVKYEIATVWGCAEYKERLESSEVKQYELLEIGKFVDSE